jgi:hypothetical protein
MSKRASFLFFAPCCTVLRSRWYQEPALESAALWVRFWSCTRRHQLRSAGLGASRNAEIIEATQSG